MSELLDEIIKFRKEQAGKYEEYLKRVAELARRLETGYSDDTPEALKKSPALRALYNNLNKNQELAVKIDQTVKDVRPDGWRGIDTRERTIKHALFGILKDEAEVERIFLIIKQQAEY